MSRDDLKILVLADSRSFHTERYMEELGRQGCQVRLASLEHGSIEHHSLKRRGPIRAFHYPLAAAEVRAMIDTLRPDVINPHFASGYGFLASLAVRHRKLPVVLHVWGSDILIVPKKSFLHRRKTRVALEVADCVIGDSDYILTEANRIGRIRARRTIVWGIEQQWLEWPRTDFELGRPLRIIVPRSHEKVYNNLFIVRALKGLVNDGRVELTFPNFGNRLDEFTADATTMVGKRLKFYSKLPRDEFLQEVAKHDVYLSAALSDSSPASLLESMGLGLIPVAGDIPGVHEWLTPESGFLFDLDSERSLCRTILQIIESGDNYAIMRRGNVERIKRKAVFEDNISEAISIMRELSAGSTR